MLGTSAGSNAFSHLHWHQCVRLGVPLSSHFITSPRWSRYLAKSDWVYSAEAAFAYSSRLFTVYWAGHFLCLLQQLLHWWPLLFLTGVGRPLVCRFLSSSPLLVRPGADLMHSLYWGHMNNLSFEFSPTLTFGCLMPTGFRFNNIDVTRFLCIIR